MVKEFKVIPVLDLKEGIVVQGIKGERTEYKPLKSVLTDSVEVLEVIKAFTEKLYLEEVYIADLDAICSGGERNQLNLLAGRREKGLKTVSILADAGVKDLNDVAGIFKAGVDKVVIGTETLLSLDKLREITGAYESHNLIASIDLKHNKVLSPSPDLAGLTAPQAIKTLAESGITNFILLEIDRVGTGLGLNKELLKECLAVYQEYFWGEVGTFILGGGISSYEDLKWLAAHGADGALVASVLHRGALDSEMIRRL